MKYISVELKFRLVNFVSMMTSAKKPIDECITRRKVSSLYDFDI